MFVIMAQSLTEQGFVGRKGVYAGAIPPVAIAKQDKAGTVIEGNNGSDLKNAIQVFVGQATAKIFAGTARGGRAMGGEGMVVMFCKETERLRD
ncbi:MAG: hypothetical protein IPL78_22780 [Chloroflexi bacterium]|nr:hypothetical protein [Chloroflexota bacterium]